MATADPMERRRLNEKYKDKNCVQCQTLLEYLGLRRLHEGPRLGAIGDFGELLESTLAVEVYLCPRCHRLEFFYFN